MHSLGVSERWEALLREREDLSLVHSSKLRVDVEVLLIQRLQQRVQHAAQTGRLRLLHNLSAGLLRIALSGDGGELVHVERVLARQLILRAAHKLELLNRHADGEQHLLDDCLIVVGAVLQQLPRRLLIVQVRVQVGEEDRDLAARAKKISDLRHRNKVRDVRSAGRRGALSIQTTDEER